MSGAPIPYKLPTLKTDIVAEPITAYRAWRVERCLLPGGKEVYRLMAWAVARIEWTDGANKAICRSTKIHSAPDPFCRCGFWAFQSEEELAGRILGPGKISRSNYAWGKVKMWGRIIEGSRMPGSIGYRAEYARPEEIILVRPGGGKMIRERIFEQIETYYQAKVSLGGDPFGSGKKVFA